MVVSRENKAVLSERLSTAFNGSDYVVVGDLDIAVRFGSDGFGDEPLRWGMSCVFHRDGCGDDLFGDSIKVVKVRSGDPLEFVFQGRDCVDGVMCSGVLAQLWWWAWKVSESDLGDWNRYCRGEERFDGIWSLYPYGKSLIPSAVRSWIYGNISVTYGLDERCARGDLVHVTEWILDKIRGIRGSLGMVYGYLTGDPYVVTRGGLCFVASLLVCYRYGITCIGGEWIGKGFYGPDSGNISNDTETIVGSAIYGVLGTTNDYYGERFGE